MSLLPLKSVIKIPTPPSILGDFSNELSQKLPDMRGISTFLRADLTAYGAVLRLLNAPMFGTERNISSVESAATALGLLRTFQVVQLSLLKRELLKLMPVNRFWETAVEMAELMAALVNQFTDLSIEDAYMVGLFNDFGVPLMMQSLPDYKHFYDETDHRSRSNLAIEETRRYGFNHHDVGYELGKQWALPRHVNQALSLQGLVDEVLTDQVALDESDTVKTLLALLEIAKEISDAYRNPGSPIASRFGLSTNALAHLGLTLTDFGNLRDDYLNKLARQSLFEKENPSQHAH